MKSCFVIIFKFLIAVTLFISSTLSMADEKKGVSMIVSFEKEVYYQSEPIFAKVTITNLGTSDLSFSFHNLLYRTVVNFEMKPDDNQKSELLNKKIMGGGLSSIKVIKMNTSFSYDLVINEYINFKTEGIFKFNVNFPFNFRSINSEEQKSESVVLSQDIKLKIIKNNSTELDKIYGGLYEKIKSVSLAQNSEIDENDNSLEKLCAIQDILVLKYLELLAESKVPHHLSCITYALEKFGKDAKPALEKVNKNDYAENSIKIKAQQLLELIK